MACGDFRVKRLSDSVYVEEERKYIGGFPGSGEQALVLTSVEHAERWVEKLEEVKTLFYSMETIGAAPDMAQ